MERLFYKKASDPGEIDMAFGQTLLIVTLGIILLLAGFKYKGADFSAWGYGKIILGIIGIYIVSFIITASQDHYLSFYLDHGLLHMEYHKKDGEVQLLTDVTLKYWWSYRAADKRIRKDGTNQDLFILVESADGEQVILKDELFIWHSFPKDWPYSHLPVDGNIQLIETSGLRKLVRKQKALQPDKTA